VGIFEVFIEFYGEFNAAHIYGIDVSCGFDSECFCSESIAKHHY
jgi:hypothetical protein